VADRAVGEQLVQLIAATPGEVYVPRHPYLSELAGKRGFAQTQAGADRVAVVEQALAGIKDLLVSQGQAPFTRRFAAASAAISRAASHTQFIGLAPRYLLECLAGVTLILAALILGGRSSTAAWLGELTFIAVAGYRLLPAIQQAYFSFVTVRANQDALDEVAADLAQASGTVGTAMAQYMFSHPDVNNFFTSLRGLPNEELRGRVQAYMDANPQVETDINGIRQPVTDLRNRCDAPAPSSG